ncbi:uncharacterized protein DEA37_0005386 [Paragonimus westermani]|uniref:Uncharacterized protein n=1 Tax=Paragonimus westermani TaxID=34504 RepID=A0A5J4NJ42_9TREM|nr:uncharacterized protein DEA37_0005386 [Paragonimus westermani]
MGASSQIDFNGALFVLLFKLTNAHSCKSTKYSERQSKGNAPPKYTRHQTQAVLSPHCAVGGGLGWVPRRTSKSAPPETSASSEPPNVPVTDDSDILEVIPELNESRLIGDHCKSFVVVLVRHALFPHYQGSLDVLFPYQSNAIMCRFGGPPITALMMQRCINVNCALHGVVTGFPLLNRT